MNEFKKFAFEDGYIESILIGVDVVKIAYQRWDNKQFNFIFKGSSYLLNNNGIYGDIGEVKIALLEKGVSQTFDDLLDSYAGDPPLCLITFFDSWNDRAVLTLAAHSIHLIDCGDSSEINAALYNIDEQQFLGGQQCPYE